MKEQILMYGVAAAIAVAAVAITSLLKIIICAIAKKCGKQLTGNAKEYLFTPIALLLAALGLYIWLERFMHLKNEEQFALIVVGFSVGTMLIYWLLFQPTRKAAKGIIRLFARKANIEPVVDVVEQIVEDSEDDSETALHSNADSAKTSELPENGEPGEDKFSNNQTTDEIQSAADKLQEMVRAIQKK